MAGGVAHEGSRMSPDEVLIWLESQPRRPTRVQVVQQYSDLLVTYWNRFGEINVTALNNAICSRWSVRGLAWIKTAAWRNAQTRMRREAKA